MLIEVIETSADSYAVLQPGLRVWLPHVLFTRLLLLRLCVSWRRCMKSTLCRAGFQGIHSSLLCLSLFLTSFSALLNPLPKCMCMCKAGKVWAKTGLLRALRGAQAVLLHSVALFTQAFVLLDSQEVWGLHHALADHWLEAWDGR